MNNPPGGPAPQKSYTSGDIAQWMSTMLSEDDVETIRQMPVEYLEKLYPLIIKWGPQGDEVEKLILWFEEKKEDFFQKEKTNILNEREVRDLVRNVSQFISNEGGASREKHVQDAVSFAMTHKYTAAKGKYEISNELRLTAILLALIARDLIWETHDSLSAFSSMITWDDYYALTGFAPSSYGPLHSDDRDAPISGILRF